MCIREARQSGRPSDKYTVIHGSRCMPQAIVCTNGKPRAGGRARRRMGERASGRASGRASEQTGGQAGARADARTGRQAGWIEAH